MEADMSFSDKRAPQKIAVTQSDMRCVKGYHFLLLTRMSEGSLPFCCEQSRVG